MRGYSESEVGGGVGVFGLVAGMVGGRWALAGMVWWVGLCCKLKWGSVEQAGQADGCGWGRGGS